VRAYLAKRFLLIPVTLLGITFITFLVMKLAPGDPSQSLKQQTGGGNMKATTANREAMDQWRKERHLDEPFLVQYGYWLRDLARFDLGQTTMPPRQSVAKVILGTVDAPGKVGWWRLLLVAALMCIPLWDLWRRRGQIPAWLVSLSVLVAVATVLKFGVEKWPQVTFGRVWITIILNMIAFALTYFIAIPVGITAAARQNSVFDRTSTVVVFLLYALPGFWFGTLMMAYVTGPNHWWAKDFGIVFPTSGFHGGTIADMGFWPWLWTWVRHLTLPVICETYAAFAFIQRQMRSSLLEQVRQDFVRTARAKGLAEHVVILKHATRNALIPVVTLLGSLLPELIAGSVIIEYLFSIPGMGQLFFEAVLERDYNVVMGIETVSALLTLMGILVSDMLYVWVNPTISYE